MTGYSSTGVRHVFYQGRDYTIIRDKRIRLVFSHVPGSHVHAERGHE